MQDRNVGAVLGERLLDELLAAGAARPASLVLRGVLERVDHAADARVAHADTRLAPGLAALTLAPGARASSTVHCGWVGHAPRVWRADGALDHSSASLQVGGARPAVVSGGGTRRPNGALQPPATKHRKRGLSADTMTQRAGTGRIPQPNGDRDEARR